ncbi:uncharacterized protein LOC101459319 [Ceratitis capitata]|uniref:(Mediterranean fruit fly) hypothetical protein n=1 Tax=Ceratitis capitata TaxID=7213 RepID=A0A811VI88_CERCA|nr:uncharacterized protein LOC101459319 [Ceratitis capitata]CAD7014811.1 unnamed protein product [Ceratitis capitata]
MKSLREQLLWCVLPTFLLLLVYQLLLTHAYLRSVRIEEIPFGRADAGEEQQQKDARLFGQRTSGGGGGIHAISSLEQRRGFFHIFNIPYIVCFFAAKGKWPFIPNFMQGRVDATARTFFKQNDSVIKQFCHKWIQIKECFRPLFATATTLSDVEMLGPVRSTPCTCANTNEPIVYFDKDHIGNVSRDTILSTIEFLETFLPPPQTPPTKKSKKKIRVRSRVDEMDID